MSALFQKIKEQFNQQLPFVCYCKPNSDKIIAFFQKNDDLVSLNDTDCGFAFVSFDNTKRYIIPENLSDIYFEKVSISDFILSDKNEWIAKEEAKSNFEKLVTKALDEIEKGTFEKVVLSRSEAIDLNNFDFGLVFSQLTANYPTAFKYGLFHPKIGLWIGASPEQFLKTEGNSIKTVALAGTVLKTDFQEIEWSNKEIREQKIVSDFIVENLKKYSKNITCSQPYNFQAGSLLHIKTDIEAVLEHKSDLEKIINLLHPTPAVCGFPKEEAKRFILNHEGYDREYYAGFLGEWNKDFLSFKEDQSDLFVNLRCMKIDAVSKKANLFVGCGINKGSNPEKEFIETVNKSQTMKRVL